MKRHEHNRGRLWVVALALVALIALPLLTIYAADVENDVTLANRQEIDDAERALKELYMAYQEMEPDTSSARWVGVERAIRIYGLNNVSGLVFEERYQTDPLSVEIRCYQAMGTVAGEVAWIYYTYRDMLDADGQAALEAAYNEILADINDVTLASQAGITRTYASGGFPARMYVAAYELLLDDLLTEGDSEAVLAKVALAKEALKQDDCLPVQVEGQVCTSHEKYQAIYDMAFVAVFVQRNQDIALAQLSEVFSILCPGENMADYEAVTAAMAALDADETVAVGTINGILKDAVSVMLDGYRPGAGAYLAAYLQALEDGVALTVSNATGSVAVIVPVFDGFAMTYARVTAKDDVVAYVADKELSNDETMKELLARYNSTGGIIDGCADTDALQFEVFRAKLLVDLHEAYLHAAHTIETYVGADSPALKDIEAEYAHTIVLISANQPNTPTEQTCRDYYKACVDYFHEATAEAEIGAFLTKHADILAKNRADITIEDLPAVMAAIKDVIQMNPVAKKKMAVDHKAVLRDLADDYTVIAEQIIAETLPADTACGEYAVPLIGQVRSQRLDAEHPDALPAFITKVNGIVDKAEAIAAVYDRYDEITASEDYACFAEADRDALSTVAQAAAEGLVNATATEGTPLSDVLAQKIAAAHVDLNRAEANARLNAKVAEGTDKTEATSAAVDAIVQAAKEAIAAETDADTIRALTDAALLDVDQEYAVQDMTATAEAIKEAISNLSFLSADELTAWVAKVDEQLKADAEKARATLDEAALEAVVTQNTNDQAAWQTAAEEQNREAEQAQKEAAKQEAEADCQEAKDAIDAKVFLSEEEKATWKARVDALLAAACDQIRAATSTVSTMAAGSELIESLNELQAELDVAEEQAQEARSEEVKISLKQMYDDFVTKVPSWFYLTSARLNQLIAEADEIKTACEEALAVAPTPDDMEAARDAAQAALDDLAREASEENLGSAHDAAIAAITDRRNELLALIDGMKYLDPAHRDGYKAEIDAVYEGAKNEILASADIVEANAAKDRGLSALDERMNMARNKNNDMCVASLTPAILVLACVLIAEIVAIAILNLVRRRRTPTVRAASFAPFAVGAVMSAGLSLPVAPATAWVLVWALALADVVLAVVLVWLIVQIYRLRVVVCDQETDEETAAEEICRYKETAIEGVRILEEPRRRKQKTLPGPDEMPRLAGPKLIYLMPPAEVMPALVNAITVEEADELISDEDALHCEETEMEDTEVYRGRKKAEINVDILARYFEAGETVTLNSLKKKGLLPRSVGHVKVLARGRLDKPLTVIAQGFSASAVKMIVLTGGKAILTEGAPERWSWRHRK